MIAYALRRITATVPVILVVAFFVFSLLYLAPGDPAAVIAGDQATPADVERIRESLGLDRPFLVRFFDWLWDVLRGDLGNSIFTNLPVSHMIAQRIEPTVSLMLLTLILSLSFAIPMGVIAAWKHGTFIDRTVMFLAVFGFSTPVFVIGYLLAYVFALKLDWLPVQGFTSISEGLGPFLRNLILPANRQAEIRPEAGSGEMRRAGARRKGARRRACLRGAQATRSIAAPRTSTISPIWPRSMISGGDRATMSPVTRVSRPRSKQSTNTS